MSANTAPINTLPNTFQTVRKSISTTPGLLKLAFSCICFASFLLWIISYLSISQVRYTVKTIGKDAVPSIIAAQKIRASLVDMDANAANAFIGNSNSIKTALEQYEKDRKIVTDSLVSAAQNITYGDEERKPILAMVDRLQIYVGMVETARLKGSPEGISILRTASSLMHSVLLPSAEALDKANFKYLDDAYSKSRAAYSLINLAILFAAAMLFVVLIGTQVFLYKRMHRILNIPLVIATILLIAFTGYLNNTLSNESAYLKNAKENAFDSIHALWKARAVAYDANGDESLYLLEVGKGELYDNSFKQKATQLLNVPVSQELITQANAGNKILAKGYIADELNNITFVGEKEAAIKLLQSYGQYLMLDTQIRQLENSGKHQEAIDLCVGTNEGQSNWAFERFDNALSSVLEINQKEFDHSIDQAFSSLEWPSLIASILAIIIVILCWFGLQPRIQEYNI